MLTLRLATDPGMPVDARTLLPGAFSSLDAMAEHKLRCGTQELRVGDLFDLLGDPSDSHWRMEGETSHIHHLGEGLSDGVLEVDGSVGRHCGAGMTGGAITIRGDAGDWLGAQLCGGRIEVHGDTGTNTGGAYRGMDRGMRGGEILVRGQAGDDLGQSMRRGLIVVAGSCGKQAGYRMRAGTILVLGDCGHRPGLEMLRGTLGLFGRVPDFGPSFRRACRYSPQALRLLREHIEGRLGAEVAESIPLEVDLHNGDLLRGGRGEVFTR